LLKDANPSSLSDVVHMLASSVSSMTSSPTAFFIFEMSDGVLEYFSIQSVKKFLQALRGYSTHLNEQKGPSQHMSRNQRLLRYG
jgi:hypothetical protein